MKSRSFIWNQEKNQNLSKKTILWKQEKISYGKTVHPIYKIFTICVSAKTLPISNEYLASQQMTRFTQKLALNRVEILGGSTKYTPFCVFSQNFS